MLTRDEFVALDRDDTLGAYRGLFDLPAGLIYLDGNSLGAQPAAVPAATRAVIDEWRDQLIGGWMSAGWWELPMALALKIGPVIGASPDQVLVCDTTTANLYKALSAAARLRSDRSVLVVEASAFPTDLYVARSVADGLGQELRLVPRGEAVVDHLDDGVAVALLNHVNFRTAEMLEMASATTSVHDVGALVVWDLSHSAGVVPIDLDGCDVDFAVGCSYKYLNGGPGAPAYLYANRRHLSDAAQPLTGWLGHAEPFVMSDEYVPAEGVRRFLTGTQPIISMRALDAALDVLAGVDIGQVRAKSMRLTDLFIELVDERCEGLGLEVISPRQGDRRGSQVSLRYPEAASVMARLADRGVRGDFRNPDILRFGFAPLYVSYADVWDAVEVLESVLAD